MSQEKQREYRRLANVEVRDATGKADTIATVVGDAVVYDSLSEPMYGFREKFLPGAFSESLDGSDLRALVDHDSRMIVGRESAGTLRVRDTPEALKVEIDIPDTSYGRDVVVSIRRGDTGGMSFCFDEAEDSWETDADGMRLRTVKRAEIYEVTITAFPAYEATSVAVRSMKAWEQSQAAATPPAADPLDEIRRLRCRLHEAAGR